MMLADAAGALKVRDIEILLHGTGAKATNLSWASSTGNPRKTFQASDHLRRLDMRGRGGVRHVIIAASVNSKTAL
jgi:hypothetical protein